MYVVTACHSCSTEIKDSSYKQHRQWITLPVQHYKPIYNIHTCICSYCTDNRDNCLCTNYCRIKHTEELSVHVQRVWLWEALPLSCTPLTYPVCITTGHLLWVALKYLAFADQSAYIPSSNSIKVCIHIVLCWPYTMHFVTASQSTH